MLKVAFYSGFAGCALRVFLTCDEVAAAYF